MFIVFRVLITSIFVSWLYHVAHSKKILHSIKDCNQQTVGVVDCRNQGWQTIPYDVFDFPVGKNSIKLGGNPFICDCRLAWFFREPYFKSRNTKIIKDLYGQYFKCSSPSRYNGRKITDLKEYRVCPTSDQFLYQTVCVRDRKRRGVLNCDYKRTLPFNIFETKMKKISLQNFGYKCDCNLVWFLRKLKQKKYSKRLYNPSNIGRCRSPTRLKNRKLQDLTEEDVCPQLPRKAHDACQGPHVPCNLMWSRCKKDKYTFYCEDIDECANGMDNNCYPGREKCINLMSFGYKCECNAGYTRYRGYGSCVDFNECSDKNRCGKNARCINLPGSYECKCNTGFIGKGKICFDVNECLRKGTCSKDAKCVNNAGSYSCSCNSGFKGNGKQCEDIDECKDSSPCPISADCSNSPGSYICRCKQGYTGNGEICTDINECSSSQHTCHRDAKCINTSPGYQCHCKPGYKTFDDGRLCKDVDECESKIHCAKQSICENTAGSFQCVCKAGYSGNGKYCDDIDECDNVKQCSPHAKCQNTDGSYRCSCNDGYHGNGKFCRDIDECTEKEDVCLLENSKCVNTPGSYQCKCVEGFSRNETQCSDIDECQSKELPHNCDMNALCINYPGGYKCQCKEGYERFSETEPCFKEEVQPLFYERTNVRIAALAVVVFLVLLTIVCCCYCCKCCCGRKEKRPTKEKDESEELLLYGAEMPFVPMDISPIPPNISMVSAYSEKQDFDYYDIE